MAAESGIKQRASRRGLRSLDGKFYHKVKERNAADRAFNKALKDRKSAQNQSAGDKPDLAGNNFDFEYKEKAETKKEPESTVMVVKYHCSNCNTPVDHGTPVCPACGARLNWEGL